MGNLQAGKTFTQDADTDTSSFRQTSIDYSSIFPTLLFCFWNILWLACVGLSIFRFGGSKIITGSCGLLVLVGILYFIRLIPTKPNNHSA